MNGAMKRRNHFTSDELLILKSAKLDSPGILTLNARQHFNRRIRIPTLIITRMFTVLLSRTSHHRVQAPLLLPIFRFDRALVKRVERLLPLLRALPDEVPVYSAGQAVMDAVAGFPMHRGILAIGRRGPLPPADALLSALGPRALVVLLFGIANHDNLGGIFRNAAAFGADAVILDGQCCDPHYRKAIRVSVGATLIVPFARLDPGGDPVALLEKHGFEPLALSPAGAESAAGGSGDVGC